MDDNWINGRVDNAAYLSPRRSPCSSCCPRCCDFFLALWQSALAHRTHDLNVETFLFHQYFGFKLLCKRCRAIVALHISSAFTVDSPLHCCFFGSWVPSGAKKNVSPLRTPVDQATNIIFSLQFPFGYHFQNRGILPDDNCRWSVHSPPFHPSHQWGIEAIESNNLFGWGTRT